MANHSLKIEFRASLMSLAVLAVMIGNAQAAIDVGRTIDSVTMVSTRTPIGVTPDGLLDETTATIISHAGVVDTQTGLQWIKSPSLAEGQALGYRAATSDEFGSFVTHMGWAPVPGTSHEFALTNGINYQASSKETGIPGRSYAMTNQAPVSFAADADRVSPRFVNWVNNADYLSLAWLDGVEGGAAGAMLTSVQTTFAYNSLKWGLSNASYTDVTTNRALIASPFDLEAGLYDTAGTKWSTVANGLPMVDGIENLKYYMVANAAPGAMPKLMTTVVTATALPEPSSYALMGLGLVGVLAATRRRGRAC
jgi:hypothetical protein